MNILIPPVLNAPRICDECPEADCTYGYTPPSCSPHCDEYNPCWSIYAPDCSNQTIH